MILLTGATGFLGSHILAILLAQNYKVAITVRESSDLFRIKELLAHTSLEIVLLQGENLRRLFEKNKISSVIHTATNYGRDNIDFEHVIAANLTLPLELLELAITNDVQMFINTDSYFNKFGMSYQTLPAYSLTKKNLKLWLLHYSQKIKVINMQIEHLYGVNDSRSKFTENIIRAVAINNVAQYPLTTGDQIRDFVFVTDAASAYLTVLEKTEAISARFINYEVGSGRGTSVREFAKKVKNLSLSDTELQFGRLQNRPDEIQSSVAANLDLIQLGWETKVGLEQGISYIIDIYRNSSYHFDHGAQ